jgi:hypothetical protein
MKYLKTPKEVAKASLIAGAIDGKYTNREVAAKLGLSEREVYVDGKKSVARKKLLFLFSEKLGFKAFYNKTLYPVKSIERLSVDGQPDLPEVTRRLLYLCFFAIVKRDHRP